MRGYNRSMKLVHFSQLFQVLCSSMYIIRWLDHEARAIMNGFSIPINEIEGSWFALSTVPENSKEASFTEGRSEGGLGGERDTAAPHTP